MAENKIKRLVLDILYVAFVISITYFLCCRMEAIL